MLDPAGDAQHAGRHIDDCFERGITLQCAEALKKAVEQAYPRVRVILSRFPGESLEPLQNANFANRLHIDLYISLHFYYEKDAKPQLSLYHFVYNPITDYWKHTYDQLSLRPYDKAHQGSIHTTKKWARHIFDSIKQDSSQFEVKGLFGIPFKPLIGVCMPALGIEASIKDKRGWQMYIQPLVASLRSIIYADIT